MNLGVSKLPLLTPDEAELFFKLHRSLMFFVNARLGVVPDVASLAQFSALSPEARVKVREALLAEPDLMESFVDENPDGLSEEELDIVRSWRHQVSGKFFVFRYLKKYTVFLSTAEPPTAYGVMALTDPLEDLVGPYLPRWIETVLLPLKGKIVYDGLLSGFNITFGGGMRHMLNDSYRAAKQRQGIVTSLPAETSPTPTKMPPSKPKPKVARPAPDKIRDILGVIVGMTDRFCRERLNEEYAALCRKLAEKLARKRPSPLLKGKRATWASGIVRAIGWVNFLDDRTQSPHMNLTEIDSWFGVAKSTGQAKSKTIRTMLKIHPFDHQWTCPSRMDDNPMTWMVEVNGFIMDVRKAPRDIQEIAFEKGLIPYLPSDQD